SPTTIEQDLSIVGETSIDIDNPDFLINGSAVGTNQDGNNDIKIVSEIVDSVNNASIQTTSINRYSLLNIRKFRLSVSVEEIIETNIYKFEHNRNAGIGDGILNSDTFSIVSSEDPLFYAITSLVFDKEVGELRESRFSGELSGAPLPLDTT